MNEIEKIRKAVYKEQMDNNEVETLLAHIDTLEQTVKRHEKTIYDLSAEVRELEQKIERRNSRIDNLIQKVKELKDGKGLLHSHNTIRNATREEDAKVAEDNQVGANKNDDYTDRLHDACCRDIAAAIRKLKEQSNE